MTTKKISKTEYKARADNRHWTNRFEIRSAEAFKRLTAAYTILAEGRPRG